MDLSITRITIKEAVPHDGAFSLADVQASKARIVQALFDQLIKDPLIFSITSGVDSMNITLDVGVIANDEMARHTKRLDNIRLLMDQL